MRARWNEESRRRWRLSVASAGGERYLSCVEMESNLVFNVLPRVLTTAMIAIEMPAAMSPYSIAVAADSSLRNATNFDM
jgi:hypothetical protein